MDATAPFGPGPDGGPARGGRLLPAGLLRESPAALRRRADLLMLTRWDAVDDRQRALLTSALARLAPGVPVVPVAFAPTALVDVPGAVSSLGDDGLKGERIGAYCGIGNPAGFRATLTRLGADVATFTALPDHHAPAPAAVHTLAEQAAAAGATRLVCTEKDLVKLRTAAFADFTPAVPVLAVRVAATYPRGDAALTAALERTVAPIPRLADATAD